MALIIRKTLNRDHFIHNSRKISDEKRHNKAIKMAIRKGLGINQGQKF
jgi:hypothetical protein